MSASPQSPYKGLSAFEDSELDALFFFGRERECEIVVANLIASRLTVLYGPSGVGKSSLLRAAVARQLRGLPEHPLVVVFSRWSEDPAGALAAAVSDVAGLEVDGGALVALERAQAAHDVYLVLDQVEEYFLYHAGEQGAETFAEALPAIVTSPLRVNVLLSVREDSLAKLDRFTGRILGLFSNTLRLDRLNRDSARAAVTRPVERFAELTGEPVSIEPQLVERVLDEVGTGRIASALSGQGAVEDDRAAARIEAPYLQLVMQRLWEEERTARSSVLRAETLERLGGSQHIVEEHLQTAMDDLSPEEKEIASRIFNHLVTPSGTKIAHEDGDLAGFAGVPLTELAPVLEALAARRILRSLEEGQGRRYEIFHDVLAEPVLAWRARYEAERELVRQRTEADRRHRRLLAVIGVGAVLMAVMAAVTIYALAQRSDARTQAREARAHELEALSASELDADPELSLLLGLEAARLAPTPTAEETLRRALFDSRVRVVVSVGKPLLSAGATRAAVFAAAEDGEVVVADARTGSTRRVTQTGQPAAEATFARDGTALLTGRDGRVRVVRPTGEIAEIPGVTGARGAEISADASLAAVLYASFVRLVDIRSGDVLQTFRHRGATAAAISSGHRIVVTGGADHTVRVWNVRKGKLKRMLAGHEGHAVAVAISPRGDLAASASTDGLGRVWRLGDGRLTAILSGHTNYLTDVEFSIDGAHVVTASRDRTARVSKADTGTPLVVLSGHRDTVSSAAFRGAAGDLVVTASADGTARLWDAASQPELAVLARFAPPIVRVEYVKSGQSVRVVTADGRAHILDARSGRELSAEPAGRPAAITGAGGAAATIRGTTVVLREGQEVRVLRGHRDRVTSAAFSPDGARLVTASRDHEVRLCDVETGQLLRVLQGHFGVVNDARFSPDGRWIATAGPRTAGLWDADSGRLVVLLRGHTGFLTSVGSDPTSRVLVTGGVDGTVRTYACTFCGGIDELEQLARDRLAATGRSLTEAERERYLR